MKNWSIEDKLAAVVVFIAAVFRFYHFDQWSLSNDELSALTRLKYATFGEMIRKGVQENDMHPMGVQSFLWIWTHLFGTGETMVRLPFVLLGIGSAILLYLTGRNMFGKAPALAAATVFSALQFPVLYAQLARPYSPGLFFSLLTTYAWSQMCLVRKEWNLRDAIVFVIGGCGAMYSHYFSFMFAGLVSLSGYFLLPRKDLLKYTAAGIAMMVLYIPNMGVFFAQFSIGGLGGPEGWLGPPGKDALWKYILYCFNESNSLFVVLLLAAVAFGCMYKGHDTLRQNRLLALLFFSLPALIAYFYSVLKNPVFQYSILLFSFPFLLLFMFSWFRPSQWKFSQFAQLTFLLVITAYSTVFAEKFYSRQFFAPFRSVADKMAEYNRKFASSGSVMNAVNVIHPDYIHYYSDRNNPVIAFSQYICNKPVNIIALRDMAAASDATTLVHGWCNNYHAPELDWILRDYFPYLVESDTFYNAGVMVFSKDSSRVRVAESMPGFRFFRDFESEPWENDSALKTTDRVYHGMHALLLNPSVEYGPTAHFTAGEMMIAKDAVIRFACRVSSDTAISEFKLVLQVQRGDNSILWRGFDVRPYQIKTGEWFAAYGGYKIQEDIQQDDKVSFYFYNPAKEKVYIDNFRLEVSK